VVVSGVMANIVQIMTAVMAANVFTIILVYGLWRSRHMTTASKFDSTVFLCVIVPVGVMMAGLLVYR
jgi:uncharacterized membrane protein